MDGKTDQKPMKAAADGEILPLLRWLEGRRDFVFLDTARPDRENRRSFLFTEPREWLVCPGRDSLEEFFAAAAARLGGGSYLAGWFAYEFGYLLEPALHSLCTGIPGPFAVLGVFGEPLVIDHGREGQGIQAGLTGGQPPGKPEAAGVGKAVPNTGREDYLRAVRRIRDYIGAGDTYQVNYTLKLRFTPRGAVSSLYANLRRNQPVAYGAWIREGGRDILSFSPELFFRAAGGRITVRPMKGTMRRGATLEEDMRRRGALAADLKNRSENVMIVDLLRNDLGRLLYGTGGGRVEPGSLFDVEVHETVLQMTSTVDGFSATGGMLPLRNILEALFPCGSVTGAPKIRTMEIIRELEKEPRGVYCGALGFCGPEEAVFNVPIRTVVLEGGNGEMGIGSGIVHDSGPEEEWRESLLKARFLTRPRPDFQLIETLLWHPGTGYWLLNEHMGRLADSAAYFLFPFDRRGILEALARETRGADSPRRVRLLLHRDGNVTLGSAPYSGRPVVPEDRPEVEDPLPFVRFSAVRTNRDNVHLYHKTTERSLYDVERRKALDEGCREVLFLNRAGEVTEGSIASIFVRRGGRLLTPPVGCGLLAGTFRRYLLDRGLAVERILSREDVHGADAVYIGNSVTGLVQVRVRRNSA
ncbi:MAG: chorismate-binding protein [Desulfobulbaceae bacterium]|jgi:para-aminobenzoate synthetase/4-amino-4-deoxychorismate lyase|nr:chorismate-binding protein [Desulfobulbaceae bacterium]MDY0351221.1 chorismate-binding protein [Desulfobulbaceae bacterium]